MQFMLLMILFPEFTFFLTNFPGFLMVNEKWIYGCTLIKLFLKLLYGKVPHACLIQTPAKVVSLTLFIYFFFCEIDKNKKNMSTLTYFLNNQMFV